MEFCHISPTPHLDLVRGSKNHLVLAHLVEQNQQYTDFYKEESKTSNIILDNSAFEMFKQNRPMYPSKKLLEMGKNIDANYIVMSDYPNEPGLKTIEAAIDLAPTFKNSGFGTFFVPQSKIGDVDDYIKTVKWAANSDLVDYIGISILGVPNAYGVEKGNNLQRFLSRWKMMETLFELGILDTIKQNGKKIHFLGMLDGYKEISLVREYNSYINTWDSSAAIWYGLSGIQFDDSPSGAINGKYEVEVDFDLKQTNPEFIQFAIDNMNKINDLCNKTTKKE